MSRMFRVVFIVLFALDNPRSNRKRWRNLKPLNSLAFRQSGKQLCNGRVVTGKKKSRDNFSQWLKYESACVCARVGEGQIGRLSRLGPERYQVEVKSPWRIMSRPGTPELVLDCKQFLQKRLRSFVRERKDGGGCINERRCAGRTIDRRCSP